MEEKKDKLNKSDDGYRRFKLMFHSIILIIAICFIIVGFQDLDRALLYLILGILFVIDSIFGLYKNVKQIGM